MFNADRPDLSELPTSRQLLRSTAIAAAVAGLLLVVVVLPAEYGVDPTGAGAVTGLTEMGRIKMQLAREAAAETAQPEPVAAVAPAAPAAAPDAGGVAQPAEAEPAVPAGRSDTFTIVLAPDDGHEVKLVMAAGAVARFQWFTDGPGVNYDTHADGAGVSYHGYEKGTNTASQEGELTAAFDGAHGWFWRNRSGRTVTLTLVTSGDYAEVKQYQ